MRHPHPNYPFRRFSRPDTPPDFPPDSTQPHRHHRHGGSGRGRRPFDYGELRIFVLGMIAAQPRHGYELIKAIEEKFSGTYSPSPGVIYPALSMLEDMGLIAQDLSEGPRKRYAITEAGRAHLAAEQPKLDALLARLGQAASGRAGVPPQILRAMENVKLALRLRLAANAPDPAQADAIAAALDDAARAIERS